MVDSEGKGQVPGRGGFGHEVQGEKLPAAVGVFGNVKDDGLLSSRRVHHKVEAGIEVVRSRSIKRNPKEGLPGEVQVDFISWKE